MLCLRFFLLSFLLLLLFNFCFLSSIYNFIVLILSELLFFFILHCFFFIILSGHSRPSRRINTPSSLNHSTLEVTSSGGGGTDTGTGIATDSASSGGIGRGHCGEEHRSTSAPVITATAESVTQPAPRQRQARFATLNCINGSDVNNVEDENDDDQQFFVNRQHRDLQQERLQQEQQRPFLRRRTPPPNYHSLPVTPPPSYTAHHQPIHQRPSTNSRDLLNGGGYNNRADADDVAQQLQQHPYPPPEFQLQPHPQLPPPQPLRRCQVPEVLGSGIDVDEADEDYVLLNGRNITERSRLRSSSVAQQRAPLEASAVVVYGQNRQESLVANGRYPSRNVATVSSQHNLHHQQQLQQRRRKQRRRKLHLLQQQHQSNSPVVLNNNNNIDTASDSDSSTSNLSETSEHINAGYVRLGCTRDQRRRRRQRLLKLRGK